MHNTNLTTTGSRADQPNIQSNQQTDTGTYTFHLDPLLLKIAVAAHNELPLSLRRFCDWRQADNPIEGIYQLVNEILDHCGQRHGPMTDISAICTHLGIQIRGGIAGSPSKRIYSLAAPREGMRLRPGRLLISDIGPQIHLPIISDIPLARITLAHEVGHFLLHWRGNVSNPEPLIDRVSWSLPVSKEEEVLSEYAARLLLMPGAQLMAPPGSNLAKSCLYVAGNKGTTVHSVALRLGDSDLVTTCATVRAAILWRLHPDALPSDPVGRRLSPQWFVCPNHYIPRMRCRARVGSLVADVAEAEGGEKPAWGVRVERVSIGNFADECIVDAFSWGSLKCGSRLVLSIFCFDMQSN